MRTLNEMNEKTREWERNGMVLSHEFAVGRVGRMRSGEKIHLLIVERVVALPNPSPYNRYRIGDVFSAHSPCNSNGQHVGQPIRGWDTDAITCRKCGS